MRLVRSAIRCHRYVGIVLSLVFMMWFASGSVMLFMHMLHLRDEDRLHGLQKLPLRAVHVNPADALERAHLHADVSSVVLTSVNARPAYHMVNDTVPSIAMSTRYNPPHDFEHSDQFNMQGSYLRTLSPGNSFRNVISYQHLNDEYREAESMSYLPATEMVSREYLYFFHHRRPLLDEANLMGKIHLGLTHHYIFGYLYEHYTNTTNRTTLSQAG